MAEKFAKISFNSRWSAIKCTGSGTNAVPGNKTDFKEEGQGKSSKKTDKHSKIKTVADSNCVDSSGNFIWDEETVNQTVSKPKSSN